MGEGLIDGLKGQTLEITKTVEKLAKDTEGTFKETLVIRSPSKVFKQLGEYITEGLVDGIKEGSDDVVDAVFFYFPGKRLLQKSFTNPVFCV